MRPSLNFGIALATGFILASSAQADTEKNLDDCYRAALARSAVLATQLELVTQAEERITQATAAILPTINLNGTFLVQQQSSTSLGQSLYAQNQNTVKLTLTQPVFHGLRDFAAKRQIDLLADAQKSTQSQARLALYRDVADAFYQVLAYEQDLINLQNELAVNEQHLKELEHFHNIGKSRQSELLAQQSNMAAVEAQMEGAKGLLAIARESLAFQTGFESSTPLKESVSITPSPGPLADWLKDLESRPDVASIKLTSQAAEESIAMSRGLHFPSLDFTADYYLARPGAASDVTWDVQLLLTFPLFAGGGIQSQVRQSASVFKQSELAVEELRREGNRDIRTLYSSVISDLAQVTRLERAMDLAEKRYQADLKDYRLGQVNNIEVLQAMTASQDAKRQRDHAVFNSKMDYIRLEVVSGRRKVPD